MQLKLMQVDRPWDRYDRASSKMNRRSFIRLGVFSTVACALGTAVPPGVLAHNKVSKSLAFFNLHTEETLAVTYWRNRDYLNGSLKKINYILRDHRTGEVAPIDPCVLDLLYSIKKSLKLKSNHPYHIISGFRSHRTNDMLRRSRGGIARKSYHLKGMAVDVRLPQVPLKTLRKAALKQQRGGVGFYPRSQFVHVDVGRVRSW